jgi:hypothetical protein
VRLNVGKTGFSLSVGKPGATVNLSKRGVRTTVGIPGTGISYSTTFKATPPRVVPARAVPAQLSAPDSAGTVEPVSHTVASKTASGGVVVFLLVVGVAVEASNNQTGSPHPSQAQVADVAPTSAPPTETKPAPFAMPDVSPLSRGEHPPADLPDYFDQRDLGAGALVALSVCLGHADANDQTRDDYCMCFADAMRVNGPRGVPPTEKQQARCETFAHTTGAKNPFASQLRIPMKEMFALYSGCLDTIPSEWPTHASAPEVYKATLCSCIVDARIAHGSLADEDSTKCEAVARYSDITGKHLTRRQFDTLGR